MSESINVSALFLRPLLLLNGVYLLNEDASEHENQSQTNQAFSVVTNYDWYSPSNTKRYSSTEFMDMVNSNNLEKGHFHSEEACYSGRFKKPCAV